MAVVVKYIMKLARAACELVSLRLYNLTWLGVLPSEREQFSNEAQLAYVYQDPIKQH